MKRNLTQNNFKYNSLLQFGNVGLIVTKPGTILSKTIKTVRQVMKKKSIKLNTSFLSKKSFLKHGIKGIKNSSWRNYLGKITSFNKDGNFNITRNFKGIITNHIISTQMLSLSIFIGINLIILTLFGAINAEFFGKKLGNKGVSLTTITCILISFISSFLVFYNLLKSSCSVYIRLATWINSDVLNVHWGFFSARLIIHSLNNNIKDLALSNDSFQKSTFSLNVSNLEMMSAEPLNASIDYMYEYYDFKLNLLKKTNSNDLYFFYESKKKFYFEKALLLDKSFLRIGNNTMKVYFFDPEFILDSEINLIKVWEIPDQKNLIDLKNYLEYNKPEEFSEFFSLEFDKQIELINLLIRTNAKESFFIDNGKLFRRSVHLANIKNVGLLYSQKNNLQLLSKEIQTSFSKGLYFDFSLLNYEFSILEGYVEKHNIKTLNKIKNITNKNKILQENLYKKIIVYSNIELKSLKFLKGFPK